MGLSSDKLKYNMTTWILTIPVEQHVFSLFVPLPFSALPGGPKDDVHDGDARKRKWPDLEQPQPPVTQCQTGHHKAGRLHCWTALSLKHTQLFSGDLPPFIHFYILCSSSSPFFRIPVSRPWRCNARCLLSLPLRPFSRSPAWWSQSAALI